jgi:hypothetical protein
LNFTVTQTTVPGADKECTTCRDNVIVISHNATTSTQADAANLTIVVHPGVYFGAYAVLSRTADTLVLDAGELGVLTASFSIPPKTTGLNPQCIDGDASTGTRFACIVLPVTKDPLVITLSFAGKQHITTAAAAAVGAAAEKKVLAEIAAAANTVGGLDEVRCSRFGP